MLTTSPGRRAAVLGKPVAHSLSPAIHNAGYLAAGLTDWSYSRRECAEDELADVVRSLGPEWAGLSLTMPLKEVALTVADEVSPLATTLRAGNTLYRREGRWLAENTDAPGMVDALGWAGVSRAERVVVLGAGGTARAALAAAADLGATDVVIQARRPDAVEQLRPLAGQLGVRLVPGDWGDARVAWSADLVISTVPSGAADAVAGARPPNPATTVFDVLYHPWPTPLAAAAQAAGCTVISGLELLLAQAARQFVLFTGVDAPLSAMREALSAAAR